MGKRKRKKRSASEDSRGRSVKRVAVLCPEPTLRLLRKFSKALRRSMRVTADDLIDLGRTNILHWDYFKELRGDKSVRPASPLKIAWISPQKKVYLTVWAGRENMDLPLYQAFDDLIQLGAFEWHMKRLSMIQPGSVDLKELARDLNPDFSVKKRGSANQSRPGDKAR